MAEGPEIIIYTDGCSRGNPGPGGYGVILQSGQYKKEISEGFRLTTNNRMELMAVIVGLEALKIEKSNVVIYTDSRYVADSVEKGWIYGWIKKRFKGIKNPDLWMRFLEIYKRHRVKFIWVKGHSEIPGNERCDQLAVEASFGKNLSEDYGYHKNEEIKE